MDVDFSIMPQDVPQDYSKADVERLLLAVLDVLEQKIVWTVQRNDEAEGKVN